VTSKVAWKLLLEFFDGSFIPSPPSLAGTVRNFIYVSIGGWRTVKFGITFFVKPFKVVASFGYVQS